MLCLLSTFLTTRGAVAGFIFYGVLHGEELHPPNQVRPFLFLMAKDPAMLWYWNDWNSGTVTLSRHLKGCYIDLLHAQFNNGHLSLDEIKTVLGPDFSAWATLQKKFETDPKGLFFNERLQLEQDKRRAFSESRRANAKAYPQASAKHMRRHMENENRNEDLSDNGIEIRPTFKEFWDAYGKKVDRPKCLKRWGKIPQVEREKIMLHVEQYVASTPDIQYRKNPSTYLNNESWNNEIVRNGNTAKQISRDDRVKYINAKYGSEGATKG